MILQLQMRIFLKNSSRMISNSCLLALSGDVGGTLSNSLETTCVDPYARLGHRFDIDNEGGTQVQRTHYLAS